MAKMIHSMIRVLREAADRNLDALMDTLREDRALAFYRAAFGLEIADRVDFSEFSLIYLGNGDSEFELELTVNRGRETPYDPGDGYGHLAVSVDNLEESHAQMTDAGLSPGDIVEFAPDGAIVARFFFITDPDGYQIEVLERGGRFR